MPSLHVVSFDNPFPPNYGGVIDVYYKIKTLVEQGVKVKLHVFEYGNRVANATLNKLCDEVTYYPRRTFVNPFIGTLPYIVNSRNHAKLLTNLLTDDSPILFEGIHTCYFLGHPALKNRIKMVRMHNIEHEYYKKLEEVETHLFKKYFFLKEAEKLEKFEKILTHAQAIFAISNNDFKTLSALYPQTKYLAAFHSNSKLNINIGMGNFAFYHGNLSVGENDQAACWLIENVFSKIDYPLIIAGNNPSKRLLKLADSHHNITLKQNIDTDAISLLIQQAHINVLPTFQATGIKLKLINVLFQGKWVLANNEMVCNTGLQHLCEIENTAEGMMSKIKQLSNLPFKDEHLATRSETLLALFSNQNSIYPLLEMLNK